MILRCVTQAATLGIVLSGVSCTSADEPGAKQVAAGEALYETRCRSCHETDGGLGTRLTDQLVRSYGSARALFDYTRMSMPWDAPGTLSDEEYWRVTAYLVHSRARELPLALDSANADSVRFH